MSELVLPAGASRRVETDDGAELAVTDLGSGRPVVLVHGWTERREVWAPVARRLLDRDRRIVLYDQRGHGSSSIGTDGCTMPRLAGDLAAVLRALDLRDAVLAGHSMGGMTILSLATEEPELLRERAAAVALVSTGASGIAATPRERSFSRVLQHRAVELPFRSPLGPLLMRRTFGRHAPAEARRLMAELFASCDHDARRDFYAAMSTMDLRACLPTLDVATVVAVGSRDPLTPPPLSDALADAIPGARLVRFDGLGHQLPLEAPDELAELLGGLP